MQKSIAKESPRRRLGRRVGAAGMAVAAVLTLGACDEARGGGYLAAPLDGEPVGVYTGRADFGFNFQCVDAIKGQITYHDDPSTINVPVNPLLPLGDVVETDFPEIQIHGTVDTVLVDADGDPETEGVVEADTCEQLVDAPVAQFEGTYRSQDTTRPGSGKFNVLVFDQGEPSRTVGDFTGDGFSIELFGGPYGAYTRGGYIEGGNIQVDN
jgi:hypothetical protein